MQCILVEEKCYISHFNAHVILSYPPETWLVQLQVQQSMEAESGHTLSSSIFHFPNTDNTHIMLILKGGTEAETMYWRREQREEMHIIAVALSPQAGIGIFYAPALDPCLTSHYCTTPLLGILSRSLTGQQRPKDQLDQKQDVIHRISATSSVISCASWWSISHPLIFLSLRIARKPLSISLPRLQLRMTKLDTARHVAV